MTVDMDEYDFVPSSLSLEAGKPYRLHLENTGGKSHTFSSDPFFKTIAVRRLTTREGTVGGHLSSRNWWCHQGKPPIWNSWRWRRANPAGLRRPLHEIFGTTGAIHVQYEDQARRIAAW